ncbi:hypothetical protein N7474_002763 [Penicillium riverlandense]|uniref:uncharacterized protein n=1 Tax=Penicillium riverlandense TaxID=1903569 RepID=UPI002546E125|nr:uncharacterized protein N7474_002763 [Penicillium riverlandense]KAJ5825625.1 hypothetical protein N7474_002763 [Penicillium riverlandense]
MRSKQMPFGPSIYSPLPFHLIHTIFFFSSAVVGAILSVFIYHLHKDGYKLPFTFLVLLVSSILSLLVILLTSIIQCICGLSTQLSMTLNTLLLLLWVISVALMSWSMSGTILTQCNTFYWGNDTGIAVCRSYKALLAFTVTSLVACIAVLWIDLRARGIQRRYRHGQYGVVMGSEPGLGEGPVSADVKLAERNYEPAPVPVSVPPAASFDEIPPPLPSQAAQLYSAPLERDHAREAQEFYEAASARSRHSAPRGRFGAGAG